jgi:hypothetical protein
MIRSSVKRLLRIVDLLAIDSTITRRDFRGAGHGEGLGGRLQGRQGHRPKVKGQAWNFRRLGKLDWVSRAATPRPPTPIAALT